MNRVIIPYKPHRQDKPPDIQNLLDQINKAKQTIFKEAILQCLGLCESVELSHVSIVYDGFHYVYYQHLRLGYLRSIFRDNSLILEFNPIPP